MKRTIINTLDHAIGSRWGIWLAIGILAGAGLATLGGCSTVKGFGHLVNGIGEDIQTLGQGAENQIADK